MPKKFTIRWNISKIYRSKYMFVFLVGLICVLSVSYFSYMLSNQTKCPHSFKTSMVGSDGFLTSAYYSKGTGMYGSLGRSEFLLSPNSTGNIMMIYDFNYNGDNECSYRTTYPSSETNLSSQDIIKNYVQNTLLYESSSNQFVPFPLINKNITLDPQISYINETLIEVNYEISVKLSADGSSYFLKIPGAHPEIVITVGDKLVGDLLPNEIVTGQNTPALPSNQ